MYCDYYKLFKLIKTLFEEYKYIVPKKISEPPVYDILNPFFEYSVDDISKMHGDVCLLLYTLIEYFNNNCDNIMAYTSKSQSGICIANFIKTLEYDNSILKDQIHLYLGYIDFFKSTQTKYLVKLMHKMELLKKEINDEINDDIDLPPPPNNTSEDESDESDGPYLELTSPVKVSRSDTIISHESIVSVSSIASIASIVNSHISSEASDDSCISETSSITNINNSSVATTSTEKKNEKFVEQNAEEKPAKKKGRPRTKDVVKTKSDKKKEVTDSEGHEVPDTQEHEVLDTQGCEYSKGIKSDTQEHGVLDTVKDSFVKDSSEGVKDNSEDFGITIDQIHEHANTIAMTIAEK